MALSIPPQQVSKGKLRAPNPGPIPSYDTAGKTAWIQLDEPDHMNAMHTTGDVLRGKTHLKLKHNTPVTLLAVYFKCEISTGLTERNGLPRVSTWTDAVFSKEVRLINEPSGRVLQGEHSFNFAIPIPNVTPSCDAAKTFPADKGFELVEGRPLAPSFWMRYGPHVERVTYYLEIDAKCKGLFNRDIKDKLPIQFCPARTTLNPSLQPKTQAHNFMLQSELLDPALRDTRAAQKRGMNKLLSSNAPRPIARFSLTGTMPTVLYVGGPVPVQIALEYLAGESTVPEVPEVSLSNVHVRLTALTMFRVPVKEYLHASHLLRKLEEKFDVINATFTPPAVIPWTGQTLQLDQLIDGFVVPSEVKPNFRSCAISRGYEIKATVEVSVAGKRMQVDVGKHSCRVLSALHREFGEAEGHEPSTRPIHDQDDPLPLYESLARSPEGDAPPPIDSLEVGESADQAWMSPPPIDQKEDQKEDERGQS